MPSNWEYVLFVYLFTWMILLGYTGWLWKTFRRLRQQVDSPSRVTKKGA